MKTSIGKMGNSQGVLIPKPFLAQTGMDIGEVAIEIENNSIVIRKLEKKACDGWAMASKNRCCSRRRPGLARARKRSG